MNKPLKMARRDVFQAIADPTRREIIHLISHRSMNLNALAENFSISRPAISLQVKILQECGLLSILTQGRERICEARLQPLVEVHAWIDNYRQHWEDRFDRLDHLLAEDDMHAGKQKRKSTRTKNKKSNH